MINVPLEDRAMLGRVDGVQLTDWNGTLIDRVRRYLQLSDSERPLCFLEVITAVRFNDTLPPRKYLDASMIEQLAERLGLSGNL
jgi:hypothetical protein